MRFMSDFLHSLAASGPPVHVRSAVLSLLAAFALGWVVAWVYRATRPESKTSASFQATLVLLAMLIAIVTQVVGENTARAFSLVGALSIVRFRTVVQDTRDTAFVIFAVVMGMAAGAGNVWMSVIGLVLVSAAAFAMRSMTAVAAPSFAYTLGMRVTLGREVDEVVKAPFAANVSRHRLVSMETARQGTAIQSTYQLEFRPDGSAEALVKALNRTDGVENVQLQETGLDDD
jgi:uncharacterized membrane protein YhiD involved in acid resistance